MLQIRNFLKRDHALASYATIFIFIGTLLTQLLPQFNFLDLSPQTAGYLAVAASACALVGGVLKKMPALTLGAVVSLLYQVVTLFLEASIGQEGKLQRILLIVSATLAVVAKFTTAETETSPLATGKKADVLPPVKTTGEQ